MTHQEENAAFEAVTAILIEHGPAAMASAYSIITNCAMQIEREQTLKAESHQRTAERQGYANGFKPKSLRTRVGEVHLRIPQTRDYHDEEGRPFYPKSLDRGELAVWRNRPLSEVTYLILDARYEKSGTAGPSCPVPYSPPSASPPTASGPSSAAVSRGARPRRTGGSSSRASRHEACTA